MIYMVWQKVNGVFSKIIKLFQIYDIVINMDDKINGIMQNMEKLENRIIVLETKVEEMQKIQNKILDHIIH